jgi:hypothetical protein
MRGGRPGPRRWIVLGLAAFGVLVPQSAPALAQQPGLESARRATAAYHDLDRALAAGYQQFLPCFDDPGAGGMGQHYVNFGLLDGTVDAAAPEALVYEVTPRGERLVAVEYLVPYAAVPSTAPAPKLFGAAFSRHDDLGVWALHAWIWRPNPAGMHADFNSRVAACPTS